jgi:ABC-type phosphate transport system substrate-binding protein
MLFAPYGLAPVVLHSWSVGVVPSDDNALSGRYPLILPVAFVFRDDKLPPAAKAFVDFMLSAEGKEILRANGYLPGK